MNIHTYAIIIALSPILAAIAIFIVVFFVEKFLQARRKRDKDSQNK